MRRATPRLPVPFSRRSTRRQIDRPSDQLGHLAPPRPDIYSSLGVGGEHPKIREVEPRANRTSHERIGRKRPRRLPVPRPDRADRSPAVGAKRTQSVPDEVVTRGTQLEELERSTLVEMPDLIRGDLMPAADRALGQEEIDGRERSTRSASISGRDLRAGSEELPKKAPLGMRAQREGRDQLCGSRMHGGIRHERYSLRMISAGSTRAAWRSGASAAPSAETLNSAAIPVKVPGSVGVTP